MSQIRDWFSLPDQELYLLLFLSGVSAAMFYLSLGYDRAAALFPRLTAGFVIIGAMLILLNRYLPEPIRTIVMSDTAAFQREEFSTDEVDSKDVQQDKISEEDRGWSWTDDHVVAAILFFGYIMLGYLIGLLWATPIFVYVYARWFDQIRWVTWSLVAISFIMALGFLYLLNLSLGTGYLHELVGIT